MKVYDCFPFLCELDFLELRLNIMDEFVDYFVIQEANTTFSGMAKELVFEKNQERFAKWKDKIIYNTFTENRPEWDQWDRDKLHKNEMDKVLARVCQDDDIIITGDMDEIPNLQQHSISSFYKPDILFHMMNKMFYYFINFEKDERWFGTKICSYSYYKTRSFDIIRNEKDKGIQIENGGWHWSFMGGLEMIKYKVESSGHQEFNVPIVKNNIAANVMNGRDIYLRGDARFRTVPIDSTYPKYILNNLERYKNWIRPI